MAPYRKAPLTPPRLLLRIVANVGTGAVLVACSSQQSPPGRIIGTVTNPPPTDEIPVVADTCPASGCSGTCLSANTHNVSTVFDGCLVWQCCVPDDASADGATDAAVEASASDAADAAGE